MKLYAQISRIYVSNFVQQSNYQHYLQNTAYALTMLTNPLTRVVAIFKACVNAL
jgi:hypothetical protein